MECVDTHASPLPCEFISPSAGIETHSGGQAPCKMNSGAWWSVPPSICTREVLTRNPLATVLVSKEGFEDAKYWIRSSHKECLDLICSQHRVRLQNLGERCLLSTSCFTQRLRVQLEGTAGLQKILS